MTRVERLLVVQSLSVEDGRKKLSCSPSAFCDTYYYYRRVCGAFGQAHVFAFIFRSFVFDLYFFKYEIFWPAVCSVVTEWIFPDLFTPGMTNATGGGETPESSRLNAAVVGKLRRWW